MFHKRTKSAKARRPRRHRSARFVRFSRVRSYALALSLAASSTCISSPNTFAQTAPGKSSPLLPSVEAVSPIAPDAPAYINEGLTHDAVSIGRIAASHSATANLIHGQLRASVSSSRWHASNGEISGRIVSTLSRAAEHRQRQSSAASAMKLHYSLAAAQQGDSVVRELGEFVLLQKVAQEQLVEKGIPLRDPTQLQRIEIQTQDKQIELDSQARQIRIQLAQLIGVDIACHYIPMESFDLSPSDADVCEKIEMAFRCRCDIVVLERLRSSVDLDSLDVWDSAAAIYLGLPRSPITSHFGKVAWRKLFNREALEQTVAARRQWLNLLIEERRKQIVADVEVAYERKRAAALRWAKAKEQNTLWNARLEQLRLIGESQGNLDQQIEAQLSELQSRPAMIERWLEWHQAEVDLQLAIGCDILAY